MADGRGGYRKPTNPAPVSGPGQHSQRTDGAQPNMQLPNAAYGEQQAYQQIQSGAPMAQQGPISAPAQGNPLADLLGGLTGLSEPSQWGGTPVTDGASMGPGQGTSALGLPTSPNAQDAQHLAKYLPA